MSGRFNQFQKFIIWNQKHPTESQHKALAKWNKSVKKQALSNKENTVLPLKMVLNTTLATLQMKTATNQPGNEKENYIWNVISQNCGKSNWWFFSLQIVITSLLHHRYQKVIFDRYFFCFYQHKAIRIIWVQLKHSLFASIFLCSHSTLSRIHCITSISWGSETIPQTPLNLNVWHQSRSWQNEKESERMTWWMVKSVFKSLWFIDCTLIPKKWKFKLNTINKLNFLSNV